MSVKINTWGCGHIHRHYSTHRWCPACANDRRRRWRGRMALGLATVVAFLFLCAAAVSK